MVLLNRSAVTVTPKQPFLDWLRQVDPSNAALTQEDLTSESTVYLLTECESDEDVAELIQENYATIFDEELNGWHRDNSVWPKNRTFGVFQEWFDWRFHAVLVDLAEGLLLRETL